MVSRMSSTRSPSHPTISIAAIVLENYKSGVIGEMVRYSDDPITYIISYVLGGYATQNVSEESIVQALEFDGLETTLRRSSLHQCMTKTRAVGGAH